jgi:NAD(P)-dependent dehydrogenase (short-subunit alcohol dehydrogenase family)
MHAMLLAKRGARVVVNDLGGSTDGMGSDAAPAQMVAEEIVAAGGQAVVNTASVATVEGAESIVTTALDRFGRLDIVVNNAGILSLDDDFGTMDPALFRRHLEVHLLGSFNVTRAAWPALAAANHGRVLMTSSSGLLGARSLIAYGSAKAGLIGLTRSLAKAGAERGINVNALFPGAETRMGASTGDAARRRAAGLSVLASTGQLTRRPELVSPVMAYLVHESCTASGEIYGSVAGSVSRVFIAETVGYANPDLSPEDVRDNWERINDERGASPLLDNTSFMANAAERLKAFR